MVFGCLLAVLGGSAALGSVASASGPSDQISQAEQSDTEAVPSPSDSDDEVRLVMVLLIAVAVIALLGTLIYWVRTGDSPRLSGGNSSDSPETEDTLG